ncbi:MAG: imidazoleglycerol-phosphate dehydratase HisB [Planctomycetota bacterium]
MPRTATITRVTGETDVRVTLTLDGTGTVAVDTGVGFFDHMLHLLGKHAMVDLDVKATGDLHVDAHHTVEDVGLSLGKALAQALGDKSGIRRYGQCRLPMDEALADVAIDLSGRAAFAGDLKLSANDRVGDFDLELVAEFFKSLAAEAKLALHIDVIRGSNLHHIAEACFKGVGRALREAVELDPRMDGVPSTKGTLVD